MMSMSDFSIFWDIETWNSPEARKMYPKFVTDMSRQHITVLGALKVTEPDWEEIEFVQWIGEDEIKEKFIPYFSDAQHTYSYNGIRFEREVLLLRLGIEYASVLDGTEIDIMHWCWDNKLMGGLKKVEIALGLERDNPPLHFLKMFSCWEQFRDYGDKDALQTLLDYNREDVYMTREVARRLR